MILEHEKQDKDMNKATPENLFVKFDTYLTEMYDIAISHE